MNRELTRRRLLRASAVATTVMTAGCVELAPISVRAASVNVTDTYAGNEVLVEATVRNNGLVSGESEVTLTADGTDVASEPVELGGRKESTVTLGHRFDRPGTYVLAVDGVDAGTVTVKPAVVLVETSLQESTVTLGDAARVDTTVRNRSEARAETTVILRIDGAEVDRRTVAVDGKTTTVVTTHHFPSTIGDRRADVNGERAGTLSVEDAWRQFGYDAANTGHETETSKPADSPSEVWSTRVIGGSRSPPVVSGDTVYIGAGNPYGVDDEGRVVAVDRGDGALRWSAQAEGPVFGAPALTGGRVVVGTTDGVLRDAERMTDLGGHVTAYTRDGTEAWSVAVGDPVLGSPTTLDGTVYVATIGGTVLALDAMDGSQHWKRSFDGVRLATPAVAGDTVYIGGRDSKLRALASDDGSDEWVYETDGWILFAPTVADDTVYVSDDGPSDYRSKSSLHAVATVDGTRQWKRTVDDLLVSSPTVDGDGIYASVGISVWGFDREDGAVRWRGPDAVAGVSGGAPTVVDGTVYASVGRVNGGIAYAFDASSGEVEWQHETGGAGASPAVFDGAVYTTVGYGTLLALR